MKKFFQNEKVKDIIFRALKTFWQAALAYIIITIEPMIHSIEQFGSFEAVKNLLITLGLGALSAGLSALYNGLLKPLALNLKAHEEELEVKKEEEDKK